jgi:hypothetical protein
MTTCRDYVLGRAAGSGQGVCVSKNIVADSAGIVAGLFGYFLVELVVCFGEGELGGKVVGK